MAYMIQDVFVLVMIYTGLMVLTGMGVYFMFYVMFKKLYGDRMKYNDPVKEDIVMCGEEPPSEDFIVPVSRVFIDILSRSFKRAIKALSTTMGSPIIHDWFFYMLIVLIIVIIASLILG